MDNIKIKKLLAGFHPDLISEILEFSAITKIPKGTLILQAGQYVKVIPIVIEGLIRVYGRFEERDLLLYYIQPGESCIMSFAATLKNKPSQVFAITEEDSNLLLMPVDRVSAWVRQFPDINTFFYQHYNMRYIELLDTINHVLFNKMDVRLYDYLKKKLKLVNQNPLILTHVQIANELGTAREVISRVMKKLEHEGKVMQHPNNRIQILVL
jgi:CRP/FNR family transcriptional regulator, anaerobic regulatory protein